MVRYLKNVLLGLDQLGTTLVGGYPDETLSSYAYRLERDGKLGGRIFRPLIDALPFWGPEHCKSSYLSERAREHIPPELRDL